MLDGENFPTAILVQFSSTHLLSWSSPWGSPSWLQPHAVTSDQSLGQHTSTALTCRKYTPLGKFRLSLKASARYQLSSRALKIRGCECASTLSSFCYYYIFFFKSGQLVSWLRGTFPVFISVRGRRLIAGADCGVNAADYRALIAMMRKRLKSHWALKPFWRVGTTSVESWCPDQHLSLPDGFSISTEMCWGEG